MLRNRQALLDQLDNIAMFSTLESSELKAVDTLALEQKDYYDDTDTEMSDISRYTDSFNDNGSIGTTDTKNTDIIPTLRPTMKELPELPKHTIRNHQSFQKQINIGMMNIQNLGNVLDCVEDLLLQENQMIEEELANVIREIGDSVPNNTFNVSLEHMLTGASKKVSGVFKELYKIQLHQTPKFIQRDDNDKLMKKEINVTYEYPGRLCPPDNPMPKQYL